MIIVALPAHLRRLAHSGEFIEVEVVGDVTQESVINAVELKYPMLRGTIREYGTQARRPFLRFFGCGEDISHQPPDMLLPTEVASGKEPFMIVGAIAGG